MNSRAVNDEDWISQEMRALVLGEKRLEEGAMKIIGDLSQNPTGSIPDFCGDWAATKAASEFFKNPVAAPERFLAAQGRATFRWLIERFHFVLKSGCALEQRQLGHAERIICFLAIANVVAWRLLWQTYLGRLNSDLPCTLVLAEYEWKALYSFIHKTALLPPETPPLGQATQ